MVKKHLPPSDVIDGALRLSGLSLGELAEAVGLKEATLYKARGGHIALSGQARRAIELFLAGRGKEAAAHGGALRSAAKADPLAEQLAFIRAHGTAEEVAILAETISAFHRQAVARRRKN